MSTNSLMTGTMFAYHDVSRCLPLVDVHIPEAWDVNLIRPVTTAILHRKRLSGHFSLELPDSRTGTK